MIRKLITPFFLDGEYRKSNSIVQSKSFLRLQNINIRNIKLYYQVLGSDMY